MCPVQFYQFPGISLSRTNRLDTSHAPMSPERILPGKPQNNPKWTKKAVPKNPPVNAPVKLNSQVVQNIPMEKPLRNFLKIKTGINAHTIYENIRISSLIMLPIIGSL